MAVPIGGFVTPPSTVARNTFGSNLIFHFGHHIVPSATSFFALQAPLGQKVRARRLARGLSQSELAGRIGITFQQVQKYENGVNRISAGRLIRIAAALNVPLTAFYDTVARKGDRSFGYLRQKGAMRIVRASTGIGGRAAKYALLTLADALAPDKRS